MTAAARRAFVARLLASTAKLARHHGFAAALWRKMVIWFGLPAAIISGLSGAFAFTDQETRAGVLALVAALLVSLSTYFGAKEHGDQHLAAAKDYRALQWDIELLAAEDDPPADRIKALLARRKALDLEHPPTFTWGIDRYGLAALAVIVGGALIWVGTRLPDVTDETRVDPITHGAPSPYTAADAVELAARFAPLLRLSSGEPYRPLSRNEYFGTSNLLRVRAKNQKAERVESFGHVVGSLSKIPKCAAPCTYYLDVVRRGKGATFTQILPRNRPAYQKLSTEIAKGTRTVYWNVVKYGDGHFAVQYWLLYLFNDFDNQHEGDWEQLTVHLGDDKEPLDVFYSAHGSGGTEAWASTPHAESHPIAYVARGSHANYTRVGAHPVQVLCLLKKCAVNTRKKTSDQADGCGPLLAPDAFGTGTLGGECANAPSVVTYRLARLGQPKFPGYYGRGNHVAGGWVPVSERGPSEPQSRRAWHDPLSLIAYAESR